MLEAFHRLASDAPEASDERHGDAAEVQRPLGNAMSQSSSDGVTQGTGEEPLARCVLLRVRQDRTVEALVIRRNLDMVHALPEGPVQGTQPAAEAALCALSVQAGLRTPAVIGDRLGSHPSLLGTVEYFAAWSCCDYGAECCADPENGTREARWVSEAEVATLCLEEEVQRRFLLAACRVSIMTTEAL